MGKNSAYIYGKILLFSIVSVLLVSNVTIAENNYSQDTAKISKHISIITKLLYSNPDSSKLYLDSLLTISKKINYQYGYYKYYNLLGNFYWANSNLDSAFINFNKALKYCNSNKPREKIVILSNIGLVYANQYNTDSANKYLLQTYILAKENNNLKMAAKAMFDLSNLNTGQDNYFEAFKYLVVAEDLSNAEKDTTLLLYIYNGYGMLFSKLNNFTKSRDYFFKVVSRNNSLQGFGNLPSTYLNLAQLYILVKPDFDSAVYYNRKAVESASPSFRDFYKLTFLLNMGNIFIEQQAYDSAIYYYKKAMNNKYYEQRNDIRAAVLVNLGTIYLKKNKIKIADEFLHKGLRLADSLGILSYQKNALEAFAELEEKKGNYKQALRHVKKLESIDDTIDMQVAKNQIISYEIEKYIAERKLDFELLKQKEILHEKILKVKNYEIMVSLLFSIVLIILLLALIKTRKKRKKLLVQSKKNNDKLIELNKSKNKFFSIIGHDLKGPFNGMLGLLDLLDKSWDSLADKDKKRYINSLLNSAEKTYVLLENMLSWGRSQQGLIKPLFQNENIFNVLTETSKLFHTSIEEKKIDFTIEVSQNLFLQTDKRILAHIFQNLIGNAVKFTPTNGKVKVFSKKENNRIKLCVADTGIGIPKGKIEHVFDLNFDFNRPGTNNEKSSGMGLILCNEYARILKTVLTVESIENKGSTFCLTF